MSETTTTKKYYLDLGGLTKYNDLIKKFITDNDLVITGTLASGDYKTIKTLSDAIKSLEGSNHTHTNKDLLDSYTQTEANLSDAVSKKHEHTNKTVLDGIDADKVAAWDAAEQNAEDFAKGLFDAIDERVDDLEGSNHTHTNKDLLDSYTQTEANLADAVSKKHEHTNKTVLDGIDADKVSKWDQAATDDHTHTNKTVLDGITSDKVAAWDAAEQNAKSYTDELANGAVKTNTEAIAKLNGTGEGSVDKKVADAIAEVVANAPENLDTLKEIADYIASDPQGVAELSNKVTALEGKAHTHSNKDLLDSYTQTEANLADAVSKKHEHTNKTVLDGITSDKVAVWDSITDFEAIGNGAIENLFK